MLCLLATTSIALNYSRPASRQRLRPFNLMRNLARDRPRSPQRRWSRAGPRGHVAAFGLTGCRHCDIEAARFVGLPLDRFTGHRSGRRRGDARPVAHWSSMPVLTMSPQRGLACCSARSRCGVAGAPVAAPARTRARAHDRHLRCRASPPPLAAGTFLPPREFAARCGKTCSPPSPSALDDEVLSRRLSPEH